MVNSDKIVLYFSYTPDTSVYTMHQAPFVESKKWNPRRGKFSSLPNDLFNCIQEVSLRRHLPSGTDGKHTCLGPCKYEIHTTNSLTYLSSYGPQLRSRCIGAQTSDQVEPDVTFDTHAGEMNGKNFETGRMASLPSSVNP
jgi:hypothetical protein